MHWLMEEQERQEMGARIKALREDRGAQAPFAEKMGVQLRTWQRYEERGTTKVDTARDIAKALGVSVDEVWGHTPGKTPDLMGSLGLEQKVDQLLDQQAELLATLSEVRDEQERLRKLQGLGGHVGEGPGT